MVPVGFIGVGTMGNPMASRLLASGYEVYAMDANQSAVEDLAGKGAKKASSVTELTENVEIIILSLPNSKIVESVIYLPGDLIGHVRPSTIVIDMGTSDPSSTVRIAADLKKKGCEMLDAPVSGGPGGAQKGTLSCMVGGSEDTFHKAMPVLQCLAATIRYIGDNGKGHTMKLINNMVGIGNLVLLCEVLSVAEKLGLDIETTLQVMQTGSPRSFAIETWGNRLASKEYETVIFRFDLAAKDVNLAQSMSAKANLPYPTFAAIHQLFQTGLALKLDQKDICSIKSVWDKLLSLNTQ